MISINIAITGRGTQEDGERVVGTTSLARESVMLESSRNAYMISRMGKIEQGVFLCAGIDWLRLIAKKLWNFLGETLTKLKRIPLQL